MKEMDNMNIEQWESFRINDPEGYKCAYCAFMYNPENVDCCGVCPENNGQDGGAGRVAGPCGQQHCWVSIHCQSESALEDDDEDELI